MKCGLREKWLWSISFCVCGIREVIYAHLLDLSVDMTMMNFCWPKPIIYVYLICIKDFNCFIMPQFYKLWKKSALMSTNLIRKILLILLKWKLICIVEEIKFFKQNRYNLIFKVYYSKIDDRNRNDILLYNISNFFNHYKSFYLHTYNFYPLHLKRIAFG